MTITGSRRPRGKLELGLKYLEVLQAETKVEARIVGNAKVYSIAQRTPLAVSLLHEEPDPGSGCRPHDVRQANDRC